MKKTRTMEVSDTVFLLRAGAATGSAAPIGLYADYSIFTGATNAGAADQSLVTALVNGGSPETTSTSLSFVNRWKFLDTLADAGGPGSQVWTITGGVMTVEDNGDYPPVDDYLPPAPPASGGHRSRARYNRAR